LLNACPSCSLVQAPSSTATTRLLSGLAGAASATARIAADEEPAPAKAGAPSASQKPHSEQAGPRLARGAACGYGPGRLIRIAEYNRIARFRLAGRDGSRTRRLSDRRRSPPGSHHGDPCAAGKEACWRFTACPFTEDNSTRGPERCSTGECWRRYHRRRRRVETLGRYRAGPQYPPVGCCYSRLQRRRKVTVVPRPTSLRIVAMPPVCWVNLYTMLSPRPVP
jgi:hypothetical protein